MNAEATQKECRRNVMTAMDIVIVGGGIGGSSVGKALACSGLNVLILERETEFVDRVRGEWIAPWGVVELKALDMYDTLMQAGGHHITRHIAYDELVDPEVAEANMLPLGVLDVPGPLTIEHVIMQNAALDSAIEAGVTVLRGVDKVQVTPGNSPEVSYLHGGQKHSVDCRLIIGADGRTSAVRRQIGLKLIEDPVDHLITGLLIGNAHDWPEDLQAIGKVGDIQYLIFPQGDGKARLYADYDISGRNRFSGEAGAAKMLAAFDMECVPHSKAIANATPLGPCRSNPSQDAWIDNPWVDGVVLIGDAAGYNDPILGQGVSVTARDARTVAGLLTQSTDWSSELFIPYGVERKERLQRLRMAARYTTTIGARFGPEAEARRGRAMQRQAENPALKSIQMAAIIGPEAIDDEYFEQEFQDELFA